MSYLVTFLKLWLVKPFARLTGWHAPCGEAGLACSFSCITIQVLMTLEFGDSDIRVSTPDQSSFYHVNPWLKVLALGQMNKQEKEERVNKTYSQYNPGLSSRMDGSVRSEPS